MMQPYIDLYERDPEAFERMCEEARREREQEQSCNCLCAVGHEDARGICDGEAEPGLTRTYHSAYVGTRHVPMCRPCHDATAVHA